MLPMILPLIHNGERVSRPLIFSLDQDSKLQRSELTQMLTRWLDSEDVQVDELAIWQWGGEAVQAREGSGPETDELVRDIVDLLAALPYEMVVLEDVPVFLDALANPLDETDLSVNLLWNHMDVVDVDTRRLQFAQHPFYGQFAGAD